jgi:hypothetical protein
VDPEAFFQLAMDLAFQLPAPAYGTEVSAEAWAAAPAAPDGATPGGEAPQGTAAGAPGEAAPPEAPAWEPPEDPFPAHGVLGTGDRGFWSGDDVLLDLALVDARSGALLWSTTVQSSLDPRHAPSMARMLRDGLKGARFLRPSR